MEAQSAITYYHNVKTEFRVKLSLVIASLFLAARAAHAYRIFWRGDCAAGPLCDGASAIPPTRPGWGHTPKSARDFIAIEERHFHAYRQQARARAKCTADDDDIS